MENVALPGHSRKEGLENLTLMRHIDGSRDRREIASDLPNGWESGDKRKLLRATITLASNGWTHLEMIKSEKFLKNWKHCFNKHSYCKRAITINCISYNTLLSMLRYLIPRISAVSFYLSISFYLHPFLNLNQQWQTSFQKKKKKNITRRC